MYLFLQLRDCVKKCKKVLVFCVLVVKLQKYLFYYRLFSYLRIHEKQVCYE